MITEIAIFLLNKLVPLNKAESGTFLYNVMVSCYVMRHIYSEVPKLNRGLTLDV